MDYLNLCETKNMLPPPQKMLDLRYESFAREFFFLLKVTQIATELLHLWISLDDVSTGSSPKILRHQFFINAI